MIDIIITALGLALKEQGKACQVEGKKGTATPWDSMNEGEAVSEAERKLHGLCRGEI